MNRIYQKPYLCYALRGFPNRLILNYRWRERKTDYLIFMQGRPLPFDTGFPHWNPTLQDPKDYDLILHTEGPQEKLLQYDCLPNNADTLIVNQRVLDLLSQLCPDDFQAFPVVIQNENPKLPDFENHDYHLLNITHCVDAIDHKKSDVKYDKKGNIDSFRRLRLKEDSLGSHHLARIGEYHPIELVSPTLVTLFKKNKIKGVRFLKDEEAYP